jgi:hypothetical protein
MSSQASHWTFDMGLYSLCFPMLSYLHHRYLLEHRIGLYRISAHIRVIENQRDHKYQVSNSFTRFRLPAHSAYSISRASPNAFLHPFLPEVLIETTSRLLKCLPLLCLAATLGLSLPDLLWPIVLLRGSDSSCYGTASAVLLFLHQSQLTPFSPSSQTRELVTFRL